MFAHRHTDTRTQEHHNHLRPNASARINKDNAELNLADNDILIGKMPFQHDHIYTTYT